MPNFKDYQDVLKTLVQDLEYRLKKFDQRALIEAGLPETLMQIQQNMTVLFNELEDRTSEIHKVMMSIRDSLKTMSDPINGPYIDPISTDTKETE